MLHGKICIKYFAVPYSILYKILYNVMSHQNTNGCSWLDDKYNVRCDLKAALHRAKGIAQ